MLFSVVAEICGFTSGYESDFPPPPPELMNANHTKQLSEASILSEASTLRQRKTPSVESLDALDEQHTPWQPAASRDIGSTEAAMEGMRNLSVNGELSTQGIIFPDCY